MQSLLSLFPPTGRILDLYRTRLSTGIVTPFSLQHGQKFATQDFEYGNSLLISVALQRSCSVAVNVSSGGFFLGQEFDDSAEDGIIAAILNVQTCAED